MHMNFSQPTKSCPASLVLSQPSDAMNQSILYALSLKGSLGQSIEKRQMSVTAYVSPGCKMHCGNLGSLTKLGNICKQRPDSDGHSEMVQIIPSVCLRFRSIRRLLVDEGRGGDLCLKSKASVLLVLYAVLAPQRAVQLVAAVELEAGGVCEHLQGPAGARRVHLGSHGRPAGQVEPELQAAADRLDPNMMLPPAQDRTRLSQSVEFQVLVLNPNLNIVPVTGP